MALPLPKIVPDVGPGGAIVTSMGGQNALTQSALQNKIASAQVPYAGWNAYADANLKMAQAKAALPLAIGQITSGPGAANLSSDNQNALAKLAQQSMGNFTNGPNIPLPNQRAGLLSRLFGNGGQQQMPQQIQQQTAPVNNMNPPPQQPSNGLNNPPVPPQQPTAANGMALGPNSLPYGRMAQDYRIPNTVPITNVGAAHAQQAALDTGATSEAANMSAEWKDNYNKAKSEAEGAQDILMTVDKLRSARSEMNRFQRGRIGGNLPAFSTAAQDYEMNMNTLQDAVARAQQTGHITGNDRDLFQKIKGDRTLTEASFNHMADFMDGVANRKRERQAFDLSASRSNLTPQQADIVWNYYINKRPFMDFKTHNNLEKNLNTWEDFLTPQKIQEAFSPKAQKAAAMDNKKNPSSASFNMPEFNNANEFQDWYKKQTPEGQKQARQALGGE